MIEFVVLNNDSSDLKIYTPAIEENIVLTVSSSKRLNRELAIPYAARILNFDVVERDPLA